MTKKIALHELPDWPAAMDQQQAAAYCGIGVDTFTEVCPVKAVRFTQSTRGHRWLRTKLDQWLEELDRQVNPDAPKRRRMGENYGGKGAAARAQ
ncbi:MAG: hypothetical protein AB7O39_03430 [Flavobacteriaceae bacterium]